MIPQLKEWQSASGKWHAAYVDSFLPHINNSVLIARALGVSYDEYVKRVIRDFKPDYIQYIEDKGFVIFSWAKQGNMRKYKNQINKELRAAGGIQI
jgi:hypothetical protein